jgi:hypothetical protein
MASDAFQFFDGVSVRGVVVFERLDALSADFLYQAMRYCCWLPDICTLQ